MYQEDEEDDDWVQRTCSRWLHEGCITDIIADDACSLINFIYCS